MKRIYHPWHAWECVHAGMYATTPPPPMSPDDALTAYRDFLADDDRFRAALDRVAREWPISCEHFLSNENINRLAWLGQASMCITTGVPACFRGGFHLLSNEQKQRANSTAAFALNDWLCAYRSPTTADALWYPDDVETVDTDALHLTGKLHNRATQYVRTWKTRGYSSDIPDEVPEQLSALRLAPSYRALCVAILKNDHDLLSLGGVPKLSAWYGAIKRIELSARPRKPSAQLELF